MWKLDFFLISTHNNDCGYMLDLHCQGSSNQYPDSGLNGIKEHIVFNL